MLYVNQMEDILKNEVKFKDWQFNITKNENYFYLQIKVVGRDNTNGRFHTWKSRKWLLSQHMTKSEFIQTAFKAVMTAMEHEIREQFRYKGESIFGGHFNVDLLRELCQSDNSLDVRD